MSPNCIESGRPVLYCNKPQTLKDLLDGRAWD